MSQLQDIVSVNILPSGINRQSQRQNATPEGVQQEPHPGRQQAAQKVRAARAEEQQASRKMRAARSEQNHATQKVRSARAQEQLAAQKVRTARNEEQQAIDAEQQQRRGELIDTVV